MSLKAQTRLFASALHEKRRHFILNKNSTAVKRAKIFNQKEAEKYFACLDFGENMKK